VRCVSAGCNVKGVETSRAKLVPLLYPNTIREIVIDLKSDDAEYKVSSVEGEEVKNRQHLPGSPSSQNPSSQDFSASTSEDEDDGQNVAGQQL